MFCNFVCREFRYETSFEVISRNLFQSAVMRIDFRIALRAVLILRKFLQDMGVGSVHMLVTDWV